MIDPLIERRWQKVFEIAEWNIPHGQLRVGNARQRLELKFSVSGAGPDRRSHLERLERKRFTRQRKSAGKICRELSVREICSMGVDHFREIPQIGAGRKRRSLPIGVDLYPSIESHRTFCDAK